MAPASTTTVYRPVGQADLDLVAPTGYRRYRRFPPALFDRSSAEIDGAIFVASPLGVIERLQLVAAEGDGPRDVALVVSTVCVDHGGRPVCRADQVAVMLVQKLRDALGRFQCPQLSLQILQALDLDLEHAANMARAPAQVQFGQR
jgi:hypothetical protein